MVEANTDDGNIRRYAIELMVKMASETPEGKAAYASTHGGADSLPDAFAQTTSERAVRIGPVWRQCRAARALQSSRVTILFPRHQIR